MKLALIGVGQAGGKIVDSFLERDASSHGVDIIEHAMSINTAETDQASLRHVPSRQRLLIGQSEVRGHGVGGDNELAAQIASRELDEIRSIVSQLSVHRIDAFLLVAALGGGTGSGATPVIASHLRDVYEEPVYGLGILPSEGDGAIFSLNAARSLTTLIEHVDNLILFDNESWRAAEESMGQGFSAMNEELIKQVDLLFRAGEITPGETVAESVVDTSEIINTLSGGGISTIGYAEDTSIQSEGTGSRGLLSRFRSQPSSTHDSATHVNRITGLTRRATLGRLTLDAEVESAERGLLIAAGPSEFLNRKGVERGRSWLEEQTGSMQIRGGDFPWREDRVAIGVILAGVTDIPRIDALQERAIAAQERMETTHAKHAHASESLATDEIDSLF